MQLHGNAKLCPASRDLMCRRVREGGLTVEHAADAAGSCERTCYRWLARFDAGESMTPVLGTAWSQKTEVVV